MKSENLAAESSSDHDVVLFDGDCKLCNRFVRFIVRRDPKRRISFASLRSDAGLALSGDSSRSERDAIIFVTKTARFERSNAVLQIAKRMRFPWPFAFALVVIPRPLRDWVYDRIARSRFKWFGGADTCLVDMPELRDRFLH